MTTDYMPIETYPDHSPTVIVLCAATASGLCAHIATRVSDADELWVDRNYQSIPGRPLLWMPIPECDEIGYLWTPDIDGFVESARDRARAA